MTAISAKWLRYVGACPLASEVNPEQNGHILAIQDEHDEFLLEKMRRELCFLEDENVQNLVPLRVTPQQYNPGQIRQLITQSPYSFSNEEELSEDVLKSTSKSWESEPIINLVDTLIEQALTREVSDIHLEPSQKELRIRFRKDGLLEEFRRMPSWASDPILIRIKILADIDITDRRIPHDGAFTYCGLQMTANIRVSTLPVQGGEKCVLRLLPQGEDSPETSRGLSHLHLSKKITDCLRTIFKSPQGLFLVTGPTGSGKTTTLHSGIQEIIQEQVNVVTIEDPVEYTLEGANQVQVNEKCGFTFASALRSILRQDPDVILVGEIRDSETAQIAIRAAQTGHLVLSTLHTNSAKGAFSRLLDLGIHQNMLNETLLGIMGQRLLRKNAGGRIAAVELFLPNGTYVDGSIADSAQKLVQQGVVTHQEAKRVLGNLYYIRQHEDF